MGVWDDKGDYPTLNKRLRGLPDWLRSVTAPSKETGYGAAGLTPALPALATPGAAALGTLAGAAVAPAAIAYGAGKLFAPKTTAKVEKGLGDLVKRFTPAVQRAEQVGSSYLTGQAESLPGAKAAKKFLLPEGARAKMEEVKADAPGAAKAGQIAGTVGQVALPAGAIVKGAKFLPMAASAALNAAPFAAGGAADVYADTGSVGEAAKSAGTNLLLAGGIGGAAGLIAGKASKIAASFRDALNDAVISAGGVNSRSLWQTIKGGIRGIAGATPKAVNELKEELADAVSKRGLFGKQALKEFIDDQGAVWKGIDNAWDAAGAKASDFAQDVLKDPSVSTYLSMTTNVPGSNESYAKVAQDTLDSVLQQAEGRKNLPEVRKLLMDKMKKGWNVGTEVGEVQGDVAAALRDAIDMKFVPQNLKDEYPTLLTLKKSLAYAEARIARDTGGSATMPRQVMNKIMQAGLGGSVTGASNALVSGDDERLSNALRSGAIGAGATLLGAGATRMLSAGQRQAFGRAAGGLRGMFTPAVAQKLQGVAGKAPAVAANVGRAIGLAGNLPDTPEAVEQQAVSQTAPATPGQETAASTGAAAGTAASTGNTEAYQQKVADVIAKAWAEQGMEAQAPGQLPMVMAYIREQTNGLDPKATAHVVFSDPDERKKFLDAYEVSQTLAGNLEKAAGYDEGFMNMFPKQKTKGEQGSQAAYLQLEKLIGDRAKAAGGDKGKAIVTERLRKVLKNKSMGPVGRRKAVEELLTMLAGTDMSLLSKAGLA